MPSLRDVTRDPSLSDLGLEGVRVPLETLLHRLLSLLLVIPVVAAVAAVAVFAELTVREAVTVQLEALRLGAVARLPLARQVLRQDRGDTRPTAGAAARADGHNLARRTVQQLLVHEVLVRLLLDSSSDSSLLHLGCWEDRGCVRRQGTGCDGYV